jgi:hypothetical protein
VSLTGGNERLATIIDSLTGANRTQAGTFTDPILPNGAVVHNHSLRLAARQTRFARAMNNSGNDISLCCFIPSRRRFVLPGRVQRSGLQNLAESPQAPS